MAEQNRAASDRADRRAAANQVPPLTGHNVVAAAELPFEYMLNALRLIDGVPMADFPARTGLAPKTIAPALATARARGWLLDDPRLLRTSATGQRFLNDVIASFLG